MSSRCLANASQSFSGGCPADLSTEAICREGGSASREGGPQRSLRATAGKPLLRWSNPVAGFFSNLLLDYLEEPLMPLEDSVRVVSLRE